jgi:DNA-binding NarL/FixJ family response regulator
MGARRSPTMVPAGNVCVAPQPSVLRFSTLAARPARDHDAPMRAGVLIVDDHEDFRDSARIMLEAAGFDVVGEAADGAQALLAEARLRPAVVLLDVQLPDTDGFAVAERLAREPDPPAIVLISSRDAAAYGDRVAASSARGFIAKIALSGRALAEVVG